MEIKDIRKIMEMTRANDVREFELENEEWRLVIKRGAEVGAPQAPVVYHSLPQGVPSAPASAPEAVPAPLAATSAPAEQDDGLAEITSPIVGTFYTASSPEAPPFVKVGDRVTEDTVVCIIEAMKVMNEIKAETKGVVRKILVDNATPVEYGQPLFKLDPNG